jgi:UDP-glucuronate 4-epimerase
MIQNKYLVTGAAGFIGFHTVKSLLDKGEAVVGIDNVNNYYDPKLKYERLRILGIDEFAINWNFEVKSDKYPNFTFIRVNLEDFFELQKICEKQKFEYIIHLAAQAGVRYSLENPSAYIQSNLVGFGNILEISRKFAIKHLIYASSSSVYGMNENIPFAITDSVDHPISLYAATKKSNELMAHTYSHLYQLPTTGLRFFTVYGPWGRPDMAYFNFSKNIIDNKEIIVYNFGKMKRDFTFISDIVNGILEVTKVVPQNVSINDAGDISNIAPYRILNFGNNKPVELLEFISILENELDKKAKIKFAELQKGDVLETWADLTLTQKVVNYYPKVEITEGLREFIVWFNEYYLDKIGN